MVGHEDYVQLKTLGEERGRFRFLKERTGTEPTSVITVSRPGESSHLRGPYSSEVPKESWDPSTWV